MADRVQGFLLTRRAVDGRDGCALEYWLAGTEKPVRVRIPGHEPVFFVERSARAEVRARRERLELTTLDGAPVDGLYFADHGALRNGHQALREAGVAAYESDVRPEDRYLMERFVRGPCEVEGEARDCGAFVEFVNPTLRPCDVTPRFRVASLDIETEGLSGALYSVALAMPDAERVYMLGQGDDTDVVRYVPTEKALLEGAFDWLDEHDPDLIIGWNVADFDLTFLDNKCREAGLPLRLGRDGGRAHIVPPANASQSAIARVPGRVVLDGIQLLRLGFWDFEQFSLDHVANELLGRRKLIDGSKHKLHEIRRMFREDKPALAAYNLEDCRLVLEIFEAADLIRFAAERARLTGLPMDRQGGSVAAFDFLYLPRLHRAGCVAPDVGTVTEPVASPGGYVMDSAPGLYDNVLVLDFKSLYPSIIWTFKIDPLGLAQPGDDPIAGYQGAAFNRERHILPGLVEELWQARDAAKRDRNTPLATAIKIIMNSLYGVLGSTGCRFFNPKLASSITRRGHELIRRSKEWIEGEGYEVIYGDTDSLFVLVGPGPDEDACRGIGEGLARGLNAFWRATLQDEHGVESHLEIEFERHYLRFFMPTIRGSETGSKKRYAGYVRTREGGCEVRFTGMEFVRSDWTALARQFQQELYRRIFEGEPYDAYVKQVAEEVLAGKHDAELVYRKRLRRKLEDYTKTAPPHVQAARKLDRPKRWVSYAITVNGPEPVEKLQSPLDYAYYLDKQLAPVADAILHVFDDSFAKLTSDQLELF